MPFQAESSSHADSLDPEGIFLFATATAPTRESFFPIFTPPCRLTLKGRRQLAAETNKWEKLTATIARILYGQTGRVSRRTGSWMVSLIQLAEAYVGKL
jgi:hypothetical protein